MADPDPDSGRKKKSDPDPAKKNPDPKQWVLRELQKVNIVPIASRKWPLTKNYRWRCSSQCTVISCAEKPN